MLNGDSTRTLAGWAYQRAFRLSVHNWINNARFTKLDAFDLPLPNNVAAVRALNSNAYFQVFVNRVQKDIDPKDETKLPLMSEDVYLDLKRNATSIDAVAIFKCNRRRCILMIQVRHDDYSLCGE